MAAGIVMLDMRRMTKETSLNTFRQRLLDILLHLDDLLLVKGEDTSQPLGDPWVHVHRGNNNLISISS